MSDKLSIKLSDFLGKWTFKLGRYIPLTGANTVWRGLDKKGRSILDLGCGKGITMSIITRRRQVFAVGTDIHLPYLRECKSRGIHDECILCDVRMLPFKPKSFDIVFCGELLEHLEKEDGWRLIKAMEEIACRQIIITTPVGMYKVVKLGNNPYLEHKSGWYPDELKALGYQVRGSGLPTIIGGRQGLVSRLPEVVRRLWFILSALANPLVHFFPKLAGNMVCIKTLGQQ